MEEHYQDQGGTDEMGETRPEGRQGFRRRTLLRGLGVLFILGALGYAGYHYFGTESSNEPNPNAPIIPPGGIPVSTPGKIVKDPDTGKEFISNQIIIGFKSGVDQNAAKALIDEIGGNALQGFTNVPLFLVELKDDETGARARRLVSELKSHELVDIVTLNYLEQAPPNAAN